MRGYTRRLYEAEMKLPGERITRDQAIEVVRLIEVEFDLAPHEVKFDARMTRTGGSYWGWQNMVKFSRDPEWLGGECNQPVASVLHEMAHAVQGSRRTELKLSFDDNNHVWHEPSSRFVWIYRELWESWYGETESFDNVMRGVLI
jgi:hypothetical protein